MQALNWYYRRLRTMAPGEIAWSTRSLLSDRANRFLLGCLQRLRPLSVVTNGDGDTLPSFRVCDRAVGDWTRLDADDVVPKQWCDSLLGSGGADR